jgi:hypothetical protein
MAKQKRYIHMIATFFLVIPHVLQLHGDHGEAFHELLHPGRPWASCPMENTWKTYGKHMEMYIYIYVYMWKITTIQTSMIYAVMICYDSYDNANKKWT